MITFFLYIIYIYLVCNNDSYIYNIEELDNLSSTAKRPPSTSLEKIEKKRAKKEKLKKTTKQKGNKSYISIKRKKFNITNTFCIMFSSLRFRQTMRCYSGFKQLAVYSVIDM